MIADCETCDRKQVPCKACEVSQRTICFICQGDIADPYGELPPAKSGATAMASAANEPFPELTREQVDALLLAQNARVVKLEKALEIARRYVRRAADGQLPTKKAERSEYQTQALGSAAAISAIMHSPLPSADRRSV